MTRLGLLNLTGDSSGVVGNRVMIGLQTGCPSGARLLAEGAERAGERRAGRARAGEQKSRKSRRAERAMLF